MPKPKRSNSAYDALTPKVVKTRSTLASQSLALALAKHAFDQGIVQIEIKTEYGGHAFAVIVTDLFSHRPKNDAGLPGVNISDLSGPAKI